MNLTRARLTPIAAVLASGLFSLHAAPAAAATILVDGSTCKLQNAVQAANTDTAVGGCTAGSGADTLVLPANSTQNLEAALRPNNYSGFAVTSDITIQGNGSTIRRPATEPNFRLVEVTGAGKLTVQNSILTGGNTTTTNGGGGILSSATTNLIDSTVTGNRASLSIRAALGGGGIRNYQGTLTLTNSTVSGNFATNAYSSDYAAGGGLSNTGTAASATLTDSTISGNFTNGSGGGINSNSSPHLNLSRCTVSGNTSLYGGGIYLRFASATLRNSTVSGNSAELLGGGLTGGRFRNSGSFRIYDSTITSNSALTGGGIGSYMGTLVMQRSLVSGNILPPFVPGNGNDTDTRGAEIKFTGAVSFAFSNNVFGHSGETRRDALPDIPNLNPTDFDATSGGAFGGGGIRVPTPLTSILDTTLRDNGGPTLTHALVPGSPAIDKPGNTVCPSTDQRGVNRPKGAACDVGAFEVGTNTADLAIAKTVSAASALVGDPLTYTLTVTNKGPDTASDVLVADTLPTGLNFVSANPVVPATGTCTSDKGTITCTLGDLLLNQSAAVTLATRAASRGTVTNTGSVISSVIDTDPNTGNNASSVSVRIGGQDIVPDGFSFTPVPNAPPNAVQTSNTITVSGLGNGVSVPVTVTGGSYSIGCTASFVTTSGTIGNGQTVCARQTASAQFSTTTTATLTIGGVSAGFAVTTAAADFTPDAFSFTDVSNVARGSAQTSNAITVTGINTSSPVTVSGGLFGINGGTCTLTSGSVVSGNQVRVCHTASSGFSTATNTTLTIGASGGLPGVSDTFTSTTRAAAPGSVQLAATSYIVGEGGGHVTIGLTRTGGSDGAASVKFATSNGSAVAGSDYTAVTSTVSWADRDSAAKTVSIAILEDTQIEGTENFNVTLSAATGASLGSVSHALVKITDDETIPTCNGLQPTRTCTVNGSPNQFCVGTPGNDTITGSSGNDVIVGLAGDDTINGGAGNDVICGGDGNDKLTGGTGLDKLYGDAGTDICIDSDSNTVRTGCESQ